jgi:hypothetical protein
LPAEVKVLVREVNKPGIIVWGQSQNRVPTCLRGKEQHIQEGWPRRTALGREQDTVLRRRMEKVRSGMSFHLAMT